MSEPRQKPRRSKQDYATPSDFIEAVKERLGISSFVHDFAASTHNAKAPNFWTIEADALAQPRWAGMMPSEDWGWLNPPFTTIGPWAKKCMETKEAGGQIAFLVPAAVGSNWFRDYVDGHARVLLLNGRIHFDPRHPTWGYPKDCILALYSPRLTPGYEVWTWKAKQQFFRSEEAS